MLNILLIRHSNIYFTQICEYFESRYVRFLKYLLWIFKYVNIVDINDHIYDYVKDEDNLTIYLNIHSIIVQYI